MLQVDQDRNDGAGREVLSHCAILSDRAQNIAFFFTDALFLAFDQLIERFGNRNPGALTVLIGFGKSQQ